MNKYQLLLLFLISYFGMFSQGSVCSDPIGDMGATPFCSITGVEFPNCNSNNPGCQISSESGPNYGCLGSTPFPAWYFMQIENEGDITLRIEQTSLPNGAGFGLDVDFICWGPFPDPITPCVAQLTSANTVGCSFSIDFVESFTVPNAQPGDFYLLLITNFSQQPGFINFEQTSGGGSTDCSILVTTLGPDQNICGFEPIDIDGETEGAVSYEWLLFNEETSDFEVLEGETNSMLRVASSGIYQISIEDENGERATDEVEINFFEQTVIQTSVTDLVECEVSNGAGVFDLNSTAQIILGNLDPSEFSVSFYSNQQNADERINPITNQFSTPTTTVYARLERNILVDCFDTVAFDLNVTLQPRLNEGTLEYAFCEQADTNPSELVLQDVDLVAQRLVDDLGNPVNVFSEDETRDTSLFTISFHRSVSDVLNNNEPLVNGDTLAVGQQIFLRVQNTAVEFECINSNNIPVITINIDPIPVFGTLDITSLNSCSISPIVQNVAVFDLRENDSIITSNSNPQSTQVLYYSSEFNFENNIPIPETEVRNFQNTENPQTIYASLTIPNSGCSNLTELVGSVNFEIRSIPLPVLSQGNQEDTFFEINNLQEDTAISLTITRRNSFNSGLDCENSLDAITGSRYQILLQPTSAPTTVTSRTLNNAFSQGVNVEATADLPIGDLTDLEYTIDGEEYQDSPIFENIPAGTIQVTARNKFGCGLQVESEVIEILDYVKFFTPNNDGINDRWNLISTQVPDNAQVFIFDRFGKLIKQIFSNSLGWDGTYAGEPVPSSSYWFRVEYEELVTRDPKVFVGNFILKR